MSRGSVSIDDQHHSLEGSPIEVTAAFQPIVDLQDHSISGYEALVRGCHGEGAGEVLERVPAEGRYAFDQHCRITAIAIASRLDVIPSLSVNVLPNALYEADTALPATLRAARRYGFPSHRLVFELTEWERVLDIDRVRTPAVRECQDQGVRVAIDDFGAGYSGLSLLAELAPNTIKLDMGLVRGIDGSRQRREIVSGVVTACKHLGIGVIAEGIETEAELATLHDLGIRYVQGYLFARPGIESLPPVRWPSESAWRRDTSLDL